jgi:chromosome partitioning protein
MLGRRRGRNRSTPQDSPDSDTASAENLSDPSAVDLVNTPPPSEIELGDPMASDLSSLSSETPASMTQPTRFKETISDVAIAHAELDNVLPPTRVAAWPAAETMEDSQIPSPPPPRVFDQEEPGPIFEAPSRVDPQPEPEATVVESTPSPPSDPPPPDPSPLATAPEPDTNDPVDAGNASVEVESDPGRQVQSASGNSLPRVMAVANQKGGVGKTTTSVNLGAALAELGFRVLVIDLDPQGNATTGLGIDARNFEISMYDVLMRDSSLEDCVEPTSMKNLFVAPATIALAGAEIELVPAFSRELKLKKSIESIIDDFDYVLIDCPPSLGLITVNALAAADEVLVPIQCEYYALEGLSQLMRNVHMVASNLNPTLDISTIVLTMYDARTKLADQVANEVRLHFGPKVCRNVIPRTVRLSEAPSFGQPITAFDPASRGAIAYRELAKEVSGGAS